MGRCKAGNDQRTRRAAGHGHAISALAGCHRACMKPRNGRARSHDAPAGDTMGELHRSFQQQRADRRALCRPRSRLCATSAVARSLAGPQMTSVEPGPALQAHTVSLNSGAASPVVPHPHRSTYRACSAVSHDGARAQGEERTSLRAGSAGLKRNANLSRAGPEGYIENLARSRCPHRVSRLHSIARRNKQRWSYGGL